VLIIRRNGLYQYIIWYILLCVGDCLVWRSLQSHTERCVLNSTNEFVFPTDSACFRFPCVSSLFVASYFYLSSILCRSLWPRDLRRGSAAARWLGLRVRIAPDQGCLSLVSVVCSQVEVSLRRADHSSRRVLPSAVCLSVITKPK
jgi:hypothetical protein